MVDRLVPCPRSSASVDRLWANVTESQVSPDGRILPDNRDTPYGRQQRPRVYTGDGLNVRSSLTVLTPPSPVSPPTPSSEPRVNPFVQSRHIERLILQEEIKTVEASRPTMAEYQRLKHHLVTALRMNEVMSRALRMQLE